MKIVRSTDRIKININGISAIIAPLQYQERIDMSNGIKINAGESSFNYLEHCKELIKRCLKSVDGIEDSEGPYSLKFEGEQLTNECAEELAGMFLNNGFTKVLGEVATANISQLDSEGVEYTILGK